MDGGDGPGSGWQLPRAYVCTPRMQLLRLCERFGLSPVDGPGHLEQCTPAELAELLAYDMIRGAEDAQRAL